MSSDAGGRLEGALDYDSRQHMDRHLRLLLDDCGVVEVRHLTGDGARSYLCDDLAALRSVRDRLAGIGNAYSTLNCPAGVVADNGAGGRALKDADMVGIMRLPFDFDAVRPNPHDPATAVEQEATLQTALRLRDWLAQFGFPEPAFTDSGNGTHLVYRCALRATPEFRAELGQLYRWLAPRFSDDSTKFDPTVCNPSRILRMPGVMNRKGIERPAHGRLHRLPKVWVPDDYAFVPHTAVNDLFSFVQDELARQRPAVSRPRRSTIGTTGTGDYRTLDVVSWFATYDLYLQETTESGKHWVHCPWEHEHTSPTGDTDAVVWEGGGVKWPSFHCSHNACTGRGIGDVMGLLGDADTYCAARFEQKPPSDGTREPTTQLSTSTAHHLGSKRSRDGTVAVLDAAMGLQA